MVQQASRNPFHFITRRVFARGVLWRSYLARAVGWVSLCAFIFQSVFFAIPAQALNPVTGLSALRQVAGRGFSYLADRGTFKLFSAKSEKPFAELMFEAAPKAAHEKFRPSSFFRNFASMTKDVTAETIMHFPPEAWMFFLANGAVSFSKGFLDYANDPIALKQYIDSQYVLQWKDAVDPSTGQPTGQKQFDPAGLFNWLGFAAFMQANGMSMGVWNILRAGRQGKVDQFMPFFGMQIGMMASSAVGDLANLAEIKKCMSDVQSRIGKLGEDKDKTPDQFETCDKVYDGWGEYVKSGLWDDLPSQFLGLAIGSVAADLPMRLVVNNLIRISGWDVAMLMSPVGIEMRAMKWAYKFSQLTSFMAFNVAVEAAQKKVELFAGQSGTMNGAEEKMVAALREAKRNNWEPTVANAKDSEALQDPSKWGPNAIPFALQELRDHARDWRNFNFKDFEATSNSWTQYLTDYVISYNAAEDFYKTFGHAVEDKLHGQNNLNGAPFLEAPQPLAGVSATGNITSIETMKDAEKYQSYQIQNLAAQKQNALKIWTPQLVSQFNVPIEDVKVLTKTIQDFPDSNQMSLEQMNTLGKDFDQLNELINKYTSKSWWGHSKAENQFAKSLLALRKLVAASDKVYPDPKWEKGEGFLASYEQDQTRSGGQNHLTGLRLPSDPVLGATAYGFRLENATDYFVASMVSGPDPKIPNSLVNPQSTLTYPARFLPPKIAAIRSAVPFGEGQQQERPTYGPVKVVLPDHQYTFPSAISVLVRADYLNPDFVADPDKFWDNEVLPQFVSGFDSFSESYQKIASQFVQLANAGHESLFNRSDFSTNPVVAARQEAAIDLFVLGDVYKDLIAKNSNDKSVFVPQVTAPESVAGAGFFATARTTKNFDDQTWVGLSDAFPGTNLKFQADTIDEIDQLGAMIQSFKGPTHENDKRIASSHSNAEFDRALAKVTFSLQDIVAQFRCQNLTPYQQKTVELAIKGLYSVATKLQIYGKMLNTASYAATAIKDGGASQAEIKDMCRQHQNAKTQNVAEQVQLKNEYCLTAIAIPNGNDVQGFDVNLNSCQPAH